MANIIMTKDEWVKRMEWICDFPRSSYKNAWPYNVLYWDGDRWWGDCVNIQKALFNGRDVYNPAKNSYQKDLSNTGDCDEWGLLSQCSGISQDFSKLKEPSILYKPGHIGAYLGKEKKVSKGIVNVVECTPAWEDGIQYSYVGPNGERCSYKGAPIAGYWTHHGKPTKWVDFTEVAPEPAPEPTPTPEPTPKKTYTDVTEKMSAYRAIMWATEQGIVQGYSDGTYRPNEPCTRAQIAIMLWRMAGRP